jgi:hypothetical protein
MENVKEAKNSGSNDRMTKELENSKRKHLTD